MTQITGKLKDSGNVVYGAKLTVTADAPFISGDGLITQKPITVDIPSTGIVDFELPQSETAEVTYTFELKDSTNTEYIIPLFHAIVPNIDEVSLWELIPVPIQSDILPSGLRRLAQIIATTPEYKNQITAFNPRGNYSADEFYVERDLVQSDGSSWLYISPVMTKGKTPHLNLDFWQLYAAKGDSGTGTSGNPDPFDSAVWADKTDAPSRGALADVILDRRLPRIEPWDKATLVNHNAGDLLALADLLKWFAKLESPSFTGDPKAPTKGVGDATNSIATCNHVKLSTDALQAAVNTALTAYYTKSQTDVITNLLAPKDSATLTGTVSIGSTAAFNRNDSMAANVRHINERLRVFAAGLSANLNLVNGSHVVLVNWFDEQIDRGSNFNPVTGQWTCPATGYYQFNIQFPLNRGSATYTGAVYKILWNVTDSVNATLVTGDTTVDDYSTLSQVIRCTQNKVYDARVFSTFSGGTPQILGAGCVFSVQWYSV